MILLALAIPLVRGRNFSEADREGAPSTVLVNRAFARVFFPGEECLGRRIQLDEHAGWMTIVGVVADVRDSPEQAASPEMYISYLQAEQANVPMNGAEMGSSMYLVARTAGDPKRLAAAMRNQVLSVDRSQPPFDVQTLEERLSGRLAPRRVNMLLMAAFAGLALLLGSIGIYGVAAYSVGRRTHEIGVRMALGAQRVQILASVLRSGMGLIAAGLALGLAASAALTRLIASIYQSGGVSVPWATCRDFLCCSVPAGRKSIQILELFDKCKGNLVRVQEGVGGSRRGVVI